MRIPLTSFLLLAFVSFSTTGLAQITVEPDASGTENEEEAAPVLKAPVLFEYIQAEYPKVAAEKGIEGSVTAKLDIDENGLVVGVTITEPGGHGFDEAAESAMYQFIFEPATRDDEPIASQVLYRYTFFLEEQPIDPEDEPPPTANLGGHIKDMDDNAIEGATVVITPVFSQIETDEIAVDATIPGNVVPDPVITDTEGKFDFIGLVPGSYQVDVVAAGMKPFTSVEDLVDGEIREVTYRLEAEEAMYETVVRGKRPPREVTRREVTRREIVRIPGTGGDALRSVQNLPGMARAPMMSGALIVRGSSPQDSRYFFDQMPVPLLYHFGGLTSIINSDLLESIDFFPGNYGVRYGGATGGIVEVYPRAPKTDRFHAYIDADIWDIGALLETPLSDCWSIAVSARRSYIDGILNAVLPEDGGLEFTVAPRYYDYQLVANYHPKPSDELQLFFFGSDDKLVMLFGEDVAENPNFVGGASFSVYFHQGQARWTHKFNKSVNNKLNISTGYIGGASSFGGLFKFENSAVPFYLRDEFTIDPGGWLAFRTGIDSEFWWAKWEVAAPAMIPAEGDELDPLTVDQQIVTTDGETTFYRLGWYGELEFRPVDGLRLIPGVRMDYHDYIEKFGFDPRFVARYEIIDGTVLKGGVGLFHQRPQDYEADENFGNPDLELIRAIHYSLGVEQRLFENIEVGVEGFYKDLNNLVVSTDETIMVDNEEVPLRYNNDGTGQVYGLEFLLKHRPTDHFFGWISYTLMKSARIDHPGEEERLFDYDQTHILTIVASAVLGRGWEAGIRFRLVTGNPDTPIIDSYYNVDSDIYIPVYGRTNSTRLPTFHQLDVRVDKNWQWEHLKLAVYIDVQNVYNQKNPEGYEYNYDYTQRQYFNGLPVLPSFGIKIEY